LIKDVKLVKKRNLTPFGYKVKHRLAQMNLTQKKLAEKIGTSEVYLSMILYGERSGHKYIPKINEVLGINEKA
jgi:transcriptional regulator with XRE-family HTH domain